MGKELVVVGIGSSAGGLEALQILLSNLPDIENCSYIIAQHLSPTHKSMMVELLNRVTNLPVVEVSNGLKIKPKTIYMTPENTDIFLKEGKIFLKNIEQAFGPKPSVNYFFGSLASEFKQKSIGIILSGTGSDGAYGVRAIKAEGGITIAQSPDSSKYDGMPLSAINTGKVDLVVSIENLALEIERIVKTLDIDIQSSMNERLLQQIYRLVFEEFGVDFSQYKASTIVRRIERRMATLKIIELKDYLDILVSSKEEISNLYHDILIGVTAFFRDKEVFYNLKEYIQTIVTKKEQGEEIRFWSIGCSTGEEAYSIAILLYEILGDKISKYKIKIFATDIDDESLKIARAGVYSETSLDGVDKKLIQKYFSIQKNQYEVRKSLRELVIFSRHNIVSDSPFLRLDLVSCRNMLIYFNQNLQNKFFPVVHYALKDGGYLFLGKSESIGNFVDLFSTIDKNGKIFKAQFTGIKEPPKLFNYSSLKTYEEPKPKKYKDDNELLEDKIIEALGTTVLNHCAVINSSNDLLYLKGKIPYINHPQGRITNNIFKLLSEELSLDLRSVINQANKERKGASTDFRSIHIVDDVYKYVRILVIPIQDDKNDDWLNILFFQTEDSQNIKGTLAFSGDENEIIKRLNGELENTKTHLQNVIEELETSYEEMQSLNEELQSSNEELQSSNEELETTNEELQSTNEELQTAYSELRVLYEDKEKRTTQLESLMERFNEKANDLRNQRDLTEAIIDTAPVAIMMVNKDGLITFANTFALELYKIPKDELLNKRYNAREWKIERFDGNLISDEELPFSIIKKTYESVYDILHTIEVNGKKAYLSINGAPVFDPQGGFEGAVFCINDISDNESLKEDVTFYKNSLEKKYSNQNNNRDNFLELVVFDIVSLFKNEISDLVLLTEIKDEAKEVLFKTNLLKIAASLDEKLQFYTKKIYFERINISEDLYTNLKLFETVFIENNIKIKNNIDISFDKKINASVSKNLFYSLIDMILKIQNNYIKKAFILQVENTRKETNLVLTFKFETPFEPLLSEKIVQEIQDMEKNFENIKFEMFENVLLLKI
jgi:two-component system, chemotaxis family, CheB/CheR fusion protein